MVKVQFNKISLTNTVRMFFNIKLFAFTHPEILV